MLGPAEAQIRVYVEANYSALPMRWPNEDWPQGANPQENGDPFIEVEIIGGINRLFAFSTPGNRVFIHPGIIRFYICVPKGTGTTVARDTADAFAALMERKEFPAADWPSGQTIRTQDFSVFDDVASLEDGNYYVRMCSAPFEFFYNN